MPKFLVSKDLPGNRIITEIKRPKSPDSVLVLRPGSTVEVSVEEYNKLRDDKLFDVSYLRHAADAKAEEKADKKASAKAEPASETPPPVA